MWPLRSHSMAAEMPAKPQPTIITLMPVGGERGKFGAIFVLGWLGFVLFWWYWYVGRKVRVQFRYC